MVDLIVLGISLQIDTHIPELLLHPIGTEHIAKIRIDAMEAFAISNALSKISGIKEQVERIIRGGLDVSFEETIISVRPGEQNDEKQPALPNVHDFFLEMLAIMGGGISLVTLKIADNGTPLATVSIITPNGGVAVDCRASDGVILSLCSGCPLRAGRDLLATSEKISELLESMPEHLREMTKASLQRTKEVAHETLEENALPPLYAEEGSKKDPTTGPIKGYLSGSRGNGNKAAFTQKEPFGMGNDQETSAPKQMDTEEERWATLLSSLSPETKKIM